MLASDPPRPLGESEAPNRPLPPTPDEDGHTGTLVNTHSNKAAANNRVRSSIGLIAVEVLWGLRRSREGLSKASSEERVQS